MLSRSSSTQSNLSAAAAAAALRRASSQADRITSDVASLSAVHISPRPPLRRRTSSMSERSFRAQAPEKHARERRERPQSMIDTRPDKDIGMNRKGSFSLTRGLRRPTSSKKKEAAPGVIPPLSTPEQSSLQSGQHKLKSSMRGERSPLSPTHSAMRLPHQPGLGSSSSSIRSYQTDLSSIVEDQPLDSAPHANPKHLYPFKSAMKGGSGPPSIISEAVSEESKSSLGTHGGKIKARVSFSDEQENVVNGPKMGKNELLNPEDGSGLVRKTSPPASPPNSPLMPTIIPMSIPTTVITEPSPTLAKPLSPPPTRAKELTPAPTPSQPKTVPNDVNNTSRVTIRVSPTPTNSSKAKLPGAFPDPTPEPTPPSTAESDGLPPLPTARPIKVDPNQHLNLRKGLSANTSSLVPTRSGGEKMVRKTSNESGSGGSVYSDAMDEMPDQKRKRNVSKAEAHAAPAKSASQFTNDRTLRKISRRPVPTSTRENGTNPPKGKNTTRPLSIPPVSTIQRDRKPMRLSLRGDEAEAMARGRMALHTIERVPSDSSFKRLKPRDTPAIRTTLRSPPVEPHRTYRRRSSSDSDLAPEPGSIFGRWKRRESIEPVTPTRVTGGSRFVDSDSDQELVLPSRGIGRTYEDVESLPSPRLKKKTMISNPFRRQETKDENAEADGEEQRKGKRASIVSLRTGKEKRFPGLRRLFRIKE